MYEIHVIFGAGPLAQAIARELVRRGSPVRMVNLSGKRPPGLSSEVQMYSGDANNQSFASQVCEGADVVYQAAQPPYSEWASRFPALQASILQAAEQAGARLVAAENLYAYGDHNGEPLHEDLPFKPRTKKGRVRAEMSEALMEAHHTGRLKAVAVRGSDFYGPGVLGSTMGERVFAPALLGKRAMLVGNPDLPHTHTYIEDFGKAMVILGEHEQAFGQAWHVPSPETVTQRKLVTMFFDEIDLPLKIGTTGKLMMRIGGLFIPEARESVEMMYEFEKPFIMDHSKFVRTFGDISTPHQQAIKATSDWYRAFIFH